MLCTPTDADKVVDKTLLLNFPPNKVARKLVVLDANGVAAKEIVLPTDAPLGQVTINMPRFVNKDTQEVCQVSLPPPMPPPPPCAPCMPSSEDFGELDFDDATAGTSPIPAIDPNARYDVVYDDYAGDTYYNVSLKEGFFMDSANTQYLAVEVEDASDTQG